MKNNENNNDNSMHSDANASGKINKDRNDRIQKRSIAVAIAGTILILVAGGIFMYSYREQSKQAHFIEEQKESFTRELNERDSLINEWMLTFMQIETDLQRIKQKENIITMQSSQENFTLDKKQQILEDVRYINTLLDSNKKKIASLNSQLKKSGGTINSLEKKIVELEASIKQSEIEISDLKMELVDRDFEIGQLNTRMTDLQMTIIQKDEKINAQTKRLNKAYIVYGTYKDLNEKGLITKEGGFLGLGKKVSLSSDFADSSFAEVNVSETRTIPVNSKDAKLISDHPSNSYELIREEEDNKIAYIEIKDPDQFWKISKYAVVRLQE